MNNLPPIILAFILFIVAMICGVYTAREWNSYQIICPPNESGEALVQSMSNGDEVLCIYSKNPMAKGRTSYKSGSLQSAYPY